MAVMQHQVVRGSEEAGPQLMGMCVKSDPPCSTVATDREETSTANRNK